MSTPGDFLWGTTCSSVQVEGAHPASDWSVWERDGRAAKSLDGNGFATNFSDDLSLIASLGFTAIRLTLEWARVEPKPGMIDSDALDRYADVLAHARAVGLTPWVTLHSTSLPGWFADDERGFLDERSRSYFWIRHVDRCGERFEDLVGGWTPIDDPVGWAIRGYALGSRPPGRTSDSLASRATLHEAVEGALLADHLAARHLSAAGAATMAVRGTPTVFEASERDATLSEAASDHARAWRALLFETWIGMVENGELVVAGRRPLHDAAWPGDFDSIGLAHDHPIGIDHRGRFGAYPGSARTTDDGFVPVPEEMGTLVSEIHARVGSPLVIASNGLATADDEWRAEVTSAVLDVVDQARTDGIPLRGYFHNTAIDGYEWLAGFGTQRGLIGRDRRVKQSGELLYERTS